MIQSIGPEKFTLKAPCKINLHLLVKEKRPDGFHELESIFVPLDFADTLVFTPLEGNGGQTAITMKPAGPFLELSRQGQVFEPIAPEKNLVYRAAELFREKTGYSGNFAVEITKCIPPGSGLGGGSSDAAAALLGLNHLAVRSGPSGRVLSREELLDLAIQMGSDVPFFIPAGEGPELAAAWVTGRGEHIKPLPPPPALGVLLAFPGFASPTGRAFGLLHTLRDFSAGSVGKIPVNGAWPPPAEWKFTNDFWELFVSHGTDQEKGLYPAILEDLQRAGASFSGLSGSGSCCFGIFDSFEDALEAQKQLSKAAYTLESTFFLAS